MGSVVPFPIRPRRLRMIKPDDERRVIVFPGSRRSADPFFEECLSAVRRNPCRSGPPEEHS